MRRRATCILCVSVLTLGSCGGSDSGATDTGGSSTSDGSGGGPTTGSDDGSQSTTTGAPECGNGIVEEGEECDLGFANDDEGECKTDCTTQACGDGFVGPEEECDDGNTEDGDECPADCVFPLEEVWSNTDQDGHASDVALDLDGNLVVVGWDYDPGDESYTAWLRKLDPDGNELWVATYHGAEDEGAGVDGVAVGPSGDLVVVGTSTQVGGNFEDAWVAGYASDDGAQLWTRTHDGNNLNDWLSGVTVDTEGNAYAVGTVFSGTQNADTLVLKLDLSALEQGSDLASATIWEHTYGNPAGMFDAASDVIVDGAGSATVVGKETSEGPTPRGDRAIWIRRLDPDGNELWTETQDGPVDESDEAIDVVALAGGGLVATGYLTVAGSLDAPETVQTAIWVGAYDDAGSSLWTQSVEADSAGEQWGRGVAVDGEVMIAVVGTVPIAEAGCTYYDCPVHPWVGAYEADGTPLWTFEEQAEYEGVFEAAVSDEGGFLYVVGSPGEASPGKALVRKYELRPSG